MRSDGHAFNDNDFSARNSFFVKRKFYTDRGLLVWTIVLQTISGGIHCLLFLRGGFCLIYMKRDKKGDSCGVL